MTDEIKLYGLYVFTHGWGRVLTVMSPAGATAAAEAIGETDGVIRHFGEQALPQYHEQRSGVLRRLIDEHGIILLTKPEWDERKRELGEAVYR
jgi:hypothetical protein